MQKILVSACLLGHRVRYDGGGFADLPPLLVRWQAEGRIISCCPEVAGGLPVPRSPAEIEPAWGGSGVLAGQARVLTRRGEDVSAAFLAGAQAALALAHQHGIRLAILKEGSPSCGSQAIYDGRFTGQRVAGSGVTTARLRQAGLAVFAEDQLAEAEALWRKLEASAERS